MTGLYTEVYTAFVHKRPVVHSSVYENFVHRKDAEVYIRRWVYIQLVHSWSAKNAPPPSSAVYFSVYSPCVHRLYILAHIQTVHCVYDCGQTTEPQHLSENGGFEKRTCQLHINSRLGGLNLQTSGQSSRAQSLAFCSLIENASAPDNNTARGTIIMIRTELLDRLTRQLDHEHARGTYLLVAACSSSDLSSVKQEQLTERKLAIMLHVDKNVHS
jgi:hypothetical protein